MAVTIGMLVAGIIDVVSPIDAVGSEFIDRIPPWLKTLAIDWFGTNDKRALRVGIIGSTAVQLRAALRAARLCYDHLAGEIGVAIADALLARRLLGRRADEYALTPAGRRWCAELDVDVSVLDAGRRPLVRVCLDWTERREHIGGALGAAIASTALERGWVRRQRDTRALTVTPAGRRDLLAPLEIRPG